MAKRNNKNEYYSAASPELSLESILSEFRVLPTEEEEAERFVAYEIPSEDSPRREEPPVAEDEPEREERSEKTAFSSEDWETPEEEAFASPEDFLRDDYMNAGRESESSAEEPISEEDPLEDMADDFLPEEAFYSASEEEADELLEEERGSRGFLRGLFQAKPNRRTGKRPQAGSDLSRRLLRIFSGAQEAGEEEEIPAKSAARHYAAQLPSIKGRTGLAFSVCLLMAWITFSADRGWPLPGQLQSDIRLCAIVLLVCQMAVLLLGLDIFTSGLVSLARGKAGAETVIAVAELASAFEAVAVIVSGAAETGAPCCLLPSLSVSCALLGAKWSCMSFQRTFLSLHHARRGFAVTAEDLPDRGDRFIIKSRRTLKGFVRRTEEPNYAESVASAAAFPMVLGSLVLATVLALLSKEKGTFFRIFSLLTALCAGCNWLLAIPMLFNRASRHLLTSGSALAGWNGAVDLGSSRRLIITDSDVFPEGTVEIIGIRMLNKENADGIISATGSLLSAADTGTASVFAELMRRAGSEMQPVEDFTVGEGGVRGMLASDEVRVGSSGYMHLSGVKIPVKMKTGSAIYTAVNGELAGIFLFRYRGIASVHRALANLRQAKRRPIFAVRDFNIDPLLLKRVFGISAEGFEFPTVPERYEISGIPFSEKSPVAAALTQGGLDLLEDVAETGTQFYRFGKVCVYLTLAALIAGWIFLIPDCLKGNWAAAGASRVALYMALQTLIPAACTLMVRK